jgi:FKBP-type peptidyl-prolyl cis-trans isomerase SlyD
MSVLIENNVVVSMHYTFTDNDGKVLGSSEGHEPLIYLHGAGNIVPGLEKALAGRKAGDSLQVKVDPSEAYGEVKQNLIQAVDIASFKDMEGPIEAGMQFNTEGPDGSTQHIVVKKVDGDQVTIDGNHPLAGKMLSFDVQVVSLREGTEEEIENKRVH